MELTRIFLRIRGNLLILILLSTARWGTSSPSSRPSEQPLKDPLGGFRIVCLFNNQHYYRGGFSPAMIEPLLCTHLNYEFAILDPKTYEMVVGYPELDFNQNFYQEAIECKKTNPNLKVMLSLGGWDDSTKKYSELVEDESRRKNFIEQAIRFLKQHEFDGLDIAWEYPNCWQGALGISPKDKGNFLDFLKEIKSQFVENDLILSASVTAMEREMKAAYDVKELSKWVDFINVMTYDMHGPWESQTGHHTQFEAKPEDPDPSCKSAVKVWIDNGADKEKLNLGLALYGKTFTLQDPNYYDIGAPTIGIGNPGPESDQGGYLHYNEICSYLNSNNWTEKEDKKLGFYAFSGNQWACYDPPAMMVRKAKYVVDEGLGGVLLKDLSGDDYRGSCFSMSFPLCKMVRNEIIHRVKTKEAIAKRHS